MGNSPIRVVSDTVLSRRSSTRATLYNWTNKILTHDGKTHVTWLDYLAANQIQTLDRRTGEWGDVDTVGCGVDNHCGPALTIDSTARLHMIVGSHGRSPFQHRMSNAPNDHSTWTPYKPVGAGPTYPSLVCDREDCLHLAYRGRAARVDWLPNHPAPHLMYQRACVGGDWLPPAELVRSAEPYGYTQYGNSLCVDRQNHLHLVFHIFDGHPEGRGHTAGYMQSVDGGNTWTKANGDGILTPAGGQTVDVLCTGPDVNLRVSNVICDAQDRPYVIVFGTPQTGEAELKWYDGTQWQSRPLLESVREGRPGCFIANDGTLSFDRDGGLYIALQTRHGEEGWGLQGAEVALLFSEDGGETFSAQAISGPGEGLPCWQPCLERVSSYHQRTPEVPTLTYTRGVKGTGCASRDYTEVHFVELGYRSHSQSSP